MRTYIVLDDTLLDKAMKFSQATTTNDVVNIALKEYVESRERAQVDIMEFFGSDVIDPTYDYKAARSG